MELPIFVTITSEFTLPPGEWLNVFLVGGGGCGAGAVELREWERRQSFYQEDKGRIKTNPFI